MITNVFADELEKRTHWPRQRCRSIANRVKTYGYERNVVQGGRDYDLDFAVLGRWLYCRRMLRPEENRGGIIINAPDKSKDYCMMMEVLAVGPQCGTPRDRTEWRRWQHIDEPLMRCPKWLAPVYHKGDTVIVPLNHPYGVIRVPGTNDEFKIDEAVPLAIIEKDEDLQA